MKVLRLIKSKIAKHKMNNKGTIKIIQIHQEDILLKKTFKVI